MRLGYKFTSEVKKLTECTKAQLSSHSMTIFGLHGWLSYIVEKEESTYTLFRFFRTVKSSLALHWSFLYIKNEKLPFLMHWVGLYIGRSKAHFIGHGHVWGECIYSKTIAHKIRHQSAARMLDIGGTEIRSKPWLAEPVHSPEARQTTLHDIYRDPVYYTM
jgi:hypothetical protein